MVNGYAGALFLYLINSFQGHMETRCWIDAGHYQERQRQRVEEIGDNAELYNNIIISHYKNGTWIIFPKWSW
jgi:hypothetical protein